MSHDIAGLERKVRALHDQTSKLHTAKHAEALIVIIHKPGWTSQREFELVQAHVDSLHHQVSGLYMACETLVSIADKIG